MRKSGSTAAVCGRQFASSPGDDKMLFYPPDPRSAAPKKAINNKVTLLIAASVLSALTDRVRLSFCLVS